MKIDSYNLLKIVLVTMGLARIIGGTILIISQFEMETVLLRLGLAFAGLLMILFSVRKFYLFFGVFAKSIKKL